MTVTFNADSLKRPREIKQEPCASKESPAKRRKTDSFATSTISPSQQIKVTVTNGHRAVTISDLTKPKEEIPQVLPDRVIDVIHILGEQKKNGRAVGFHFAPRGSDLLDRLKDITENRDSGVFFAKVPNGKNAWKGSSFFPIEIPDLRSLNDLLLTRKEIARRNNSALYKVERDPAEKSFHYMTYLSKTGVENSCFPVFDFIEIEDNSDKEICFGGGVLSKSQSELVSLANEILTDLMRTKDPVDPKTCLVKFVLRDDYRRPTRLIFDLAPRISSKIGVGLGLLVSIKGEHLNYFRGNALQAVLAQIK